MPNQYTKVELKLEVQLPQDTSHLKKKYTKAVLELLKNKISRNPQLIDEIIKKVKEDLD
jgi:uncharacterized protein (DUF2267 family)